MKQKKNARAHKTIEHQIEDLKRTIAKYGDSDGSRTNQLEKLMNVRRANKAINFGLLYGMSPETAKRYGTVDGMFKKHASKRQASLPIEREEEGFGKDNDITAPRD